MAYPANTVDSDAVAQDQIRAFVERIERPGISTAADLAASIADRDARHEHCLGRLVDFDRHAPLAIERARTAAGSLLGCNSDTVIHRAAMWKRHGGLAGAIHALDWMAGPVWPVPVIASGLVGQVYAMAASDFPGIFKVGFSTDPERRRAELQSRHRIALRLLVTAPGTRVDESLVHFDLRRFALANEWFDLVGNWKEVKPTARFLTPDRMWREMREVA
jgi:hypothetical protein